MTKTIGQFVLFVLCLVFLGCAVMVPIANQYIATSGPAWLTAGVPTTRIEPRLEVDDIGEIMLWRDVSVTIIRPNYDNLNYSSCLLFVALLGSAWISLCGLIVSFPEPPKAAS